MIDSEHKNVPDIDVLNSLLYLISNRVSETVLKVAVNSFLGKYYKNLTAVFTTFLKESQNMLYIKNQLVCVLMKKIVKMTNLIKICIKN